MDDFISLFLYSLSLSSLSLSLSSGRSTTLAQVGRKHSAGTVPGAHLPSQPPSRSLSSGKSKDNLPSSNSVSSSTGAGVKG